MSCIILNLLLDETLLVIVYFFSWYFFHHCLSLIFFRDFWNEEILAEELITVVNAFVGLV